MDQSVFGCAQVASHLTIISGTTGALNGRMLAGQKNATATGDAFAALLGDKRLETPPAKTQDTDRAETELERVARLAQEAAAGGATDGDTDTSDAVAAAIDLQPAPTEPVDPTPMVDLVDALSALKASLDAGKPLDPDLVKRIDQALSTLADRLGLDLASLQVPDDIAALLANAQAGENSLSKALAQMLAPLADAPTAATDDNPLKPISDKLAALLAALENGAAGEDRLAAIGMKPGAPPAEDIELALSRFAALLKTEAPVPEEPVLAAPVLKTSEPTLAGKAAEAVPQPTPRPDTVKLEDKANDRPERPTVREADAPRRDTRPTPAAAPATADTNTAPQAGAPAAQDTGVLRIDPAATPRVVQQAGYQTSQQQLNLPQIAFELGRQVQDGNTRFQIRLDPPELGRIDVRLDIDKAGQVHARLTVEKSETLDLMQRDQRALERALQQAGLDAGKTNLEFSLKQNPFAGQDRNEQGGKGLFGGENALAGEAEDTPPPTVNLYRGSLQASGVNIIA